MSHQTTEQIGFNIPGWSPNLRLERRMTQKYKKHPDFILQHSDMETRQRIDYGLLPTRTLVEAQHRQYEIFLPDGIQTIPVRQETRY